MYTVNDSVLERHAVSVRDRYSVSERHDVSVRDRYLRLIYTYLCVRETSSPGPYGLRGL